MPSHLAHSDPKTNVKLGHALHRRQRKVASAFNRFVANFYKPFLLKCLNHRYLTLTIAGCVLVITGAFATSDHMGMVMMPRQAADEIEAGVRLPVGTTQAQAARVAQSITDSTYEMFVEHDLFKVAEGIKTNVRGQNFIDVEIVLKAPEERDMSALEVDVNDSYRQGKMQYNFHVLPQGEALGLTPEYIGQQVRDAFYGAVAMRQLRGTNEVEVRVKLPDAERNQLSTLESFVLTLPNGGEVPLMDVAELKQGEAFSSLERREGRRVVSVGMDVEPAGAVSQVLDAINQDVLPDLLQKYPGLTWSFSGTQAEMRESTQVLWGGFAMAMFIIYSLLAIAFRSYSQPFIVMLAIPFGAIGAVLGHLMLGYDLSIVSLMGLVALSGVVVNGALIMVDFANKKAKEISRFDAILEAGVRRFRPIVLTTLTTFGGLTPIILEQSRQAYQLIPMAISLGFGIVFATAIILVIVPCFYLVLEDLWGKHVKSDKSVTQNV